MTKDEILKKLKENSYYANGDFEVLGLTDTAIPGAKVLCKCNVCGHEWNAFLHNLLYRNTGCPHWQNHEERLYKTLPKTMLDDNVVWLNPNISNTEHLYEFECTKHGRFTLTQGGIWAAKNRGQKIICPICRSVNIFNKRISENTHFQDGNIWLAEEWNGYDQIVECVCKKHGRFYIDRTNLARGRGCQKCSFENSNMGKQASIKTERVIEFFKENPSATCKEAGKILNMSPESVNYHTKKAGITPNVRRGKHLEIFLALYKKHPDWTAEKFAEAVGVCLETIRLYARDNNINLKRNSQVKKR